MKIVTMKDLDELLQALSNLRKKTLVMEKLTNDSLTVVQHNAIEGNLDGAAVFGLKVMAVFSDESDEMFSRLEKPAFKVFGETRKPTETAREYFERIAAMDDSQILATMRRNGHALTGGID